MHRQFRVSCSCEAQGDIHIHTMAMLNQEIKANKVLALKQSLFKRVET